MFSTNLRRPLLALAVTAGLLAVAGPASASAWHEAARTGIHGEGADKASIIVYDFEGEAVHQMPRGGSVWAPGDGSDFVVGPASRSTIATVARQADGNEVHPRRAAKRRELKRRISCAINNGWIADRPTRVIIRAFKAGNPTVVNGIAAADPQVCMIGI